jgi:hypothetical protein
MDHGAAGTTRLSDLNYFALTNNFWTRWNPSGNGGLGNIASQRRDALRRRRSLPTEYIVHIERLDHYRDVLRDTAQELPRQVAHAAHAQASGWCVIPQRHCEPTGRANAPDDGLREAIQSPEEELDCVVARAPRNDGGGDAELTLFIRSSLQPPSPAPRSRSGNGAPARPSRARPRWQSRRPSR